MVTKKNVLKENSEEFRNRVLYITKDNDFVRSVYYAVGPDKKPYSFVLSLGQFRFINYLISHVKPGDTDFKEETISYKDYFRITGLKDGGKSRNIIETSVLELCNTDFYINVKDGIKVISWLKSGTFINQKNNTITVQLDDTLKPYILNLKKCFTAYMQGFTLDFKSKYSCSIYEYCRSILSQGCIITNTDKFMEKICGDIYPVMAKFKEKVLYPAIVEINEKSDIQVSLTEIREHNKTIKIRFDVEDKSDEAKREILYKYWGIDRDMLIDGSFDYLFYNNKKGFKGSVFEEDALVLPF